MFLLIMAVFVACWIVTAIFSYVIYGNVLQTASRTDLALRSLTWAALVYACDHDGVFPTSEAELFSTQPLPRSIDCVPDDPGAWPSSWSEVSDDSPPAPDLKEASKKLRLFFASGGDMPPVIDANGLPTEHFTIGIIREWLENFHAARPPVPGG